MKTKWFAAAGPAAALGVVAVAIALAASLAGCGGGTGGAPSSSRTATRQASVTTTTTASSATSTAPRPHRRRHRRHHAPPPGSLPQTHALPSAHTGTFMREMAALWRGVRRNSVRAALPAFFPEDAYAQVKAIGDPEADWSDRLVATYRLDIGAAHALLSAGGAHATLLRVNVPRAYAHWVDPGACYNRIGYWEVPNSRVVYRDAGHVRSFGIASMISWRGVWYVIHLGAVSGDTGGTVDEPSEGPGASTPSSTC